GLRGFRVQALRLTATGLGLATAWAGPTAAPTATVLMASAAAMATRVRVSCDCDDISNLPFCPAVLFAGRCLHLIKERANPGKLRKTALKRRGQRISPTKSCPETQMPVWDHPRPPPLQSPHRSKRTVRRDRQLFR